MSIKSNALASGELAKGANQSGQTQGDYSTAAYILNNRPYARHIPDLWEIPQELAELPIWCAWKLVYKAGRAKPDKQPVSPTDGGQAWKANKATFCTTAEQAIHYAESRKGLHGIGFILYDDAEHRIIGGDIDHCVNDAGELSDKARKIVEQADTYTELSPSLGGLRFIARGTFGGYTGNNQAEGVELYEDGRFLTFTGFHIEETPFAVEHRDLTELGKEYHQKGEKTNSDQDRPAPSESSDFNDL